MKLRKIAIGFVIAMLAILLAMLHWTDRNDYEKRDMVYYNDCIWQMVQAYQTGDDISKVEQEYGCRLLLADDDDYAAALFSAYQSDGLVMDFAPDGAVIGNVVWTDEENAFTKAKQELKIGLIIFWGVALLTGLCLLGAVYLWLIRPFRELQEYTAQIAKGNLELPLPIHRNNFFGAFTESFDILREELASTRQREYEANQSKKELVAELSHDIKTPVSSIKATCEVLEIREQDPDTLEKIGYIQAKADTIDRLVGNLFHATLEELEVLECDPQLTDSGVMERFFEELKYYGNIICENRVPECLVMMDPLRMEQVIDNIVNNAYKYAGTDVHVSYEDSTDGIMIRIRDAGPGVPEEDLARITEKYYRGGNASGKQGQGLGLYLAKWFMERQGGDIEYYNDGGFVAELFLRKG